METYPRWAHETDPFALSSGLVCPLEAVRYWRQVLQSHRRDNVLEENFKRAQPDDKRCHRGDSAGEKDRQPVRSEQVI